MMKSNVEGVKFRRTSHLKRGVAREIVDFMAETL